MFGWLFKKKKDAYTMSNGAKKNKDGPLISREVLAKLKIPRKFEIYVEEYTEGDIGCQAGWRPVQVDSKLGGTGGNPVITVNSQTDLQEKQNFYKAVGQRFTIVREIDPPTADEIKKAAIEQGLIDADSDFQPNAENTSDENTACPAVNDVPTKAAPEPPPPPPPKRETRYYKVGDVEIKEENGQLYQKQWLQLSPAESSNFRIVSDSNNKIISMKGRHIEAKKWIKIENANCEQVDPEVIINA